MTRQQSSSTFVQPDGTRKTVTVSEFITSDDVMLLAMKSIAAEIKFGITYQSSATPFVRDYLLLTNYDV